MKNETKRTIKSSVKTCQLVLLFFCHKNIGNLFQYINKGIHLSLYFFLLLAARKAKNKYLLLFFKVFLICNERSFKLQRIRNCGMDHSKELLLLLKPLLTCLRQTLKLLASCQRSRKKVHWSNVWLFIQTLVWRGKCGSGILFYWWVEEEVEEWLVCGTKTFRGSGFFQTQVNVWWEGSVKGCWWMVCGSSNTNATCWLITLVCFHEKTCQ